MEEIKKFDIVVLHESTISSWLKDIGTFGILGLMLYANFRWFGNHGIVAFGFLLMMIISLVGNSKRLSNQFTDKESAIKFINEL